MSVLEEFGLVALVEEVPALPGLLLQLLGPELGHEARVLLLQQLHRLRL